MFIASKFRLLFADYTQSYFQMNSWNKEVEFYSIFMKNYGVKMIVLSKTIYFL